MGYHENHRVQVVRFNEGLLKAIIDRMLREAGIMSHSRKSLFLCSGDNLTVPDQRRCRIMIESGNTKDIQCHAALRRARISSVAMTAGANARANASCPATVG